MALSYLWCDAPWLLADISALVHRLRKKAVHRVLAAYAKLNHMYAELIA